MNYYLLGGGGAGPPPTNDYLLGVGGLGGLKKGTPPLSEVPMTLTGSLITMHRLYTQKNANCQALYVVFTRLHLGWVQCNV